MTTEKMLQEILNKVYPDVMIHTIEVDGNVSYVPISLARLLSALGDDWLFDSVGMFHIGNPTHTVFDWKILNEDNSDAMLNDQSPETIKAIWEIVCK